jgi:hypothetical protein
MNDMPLNQDQILLLKSRIDNVFEALEKAENTKWQDTLTAMGASCDSLLHILGNIQVQNEKCIA